ncbi:MAG: DUF4397 domain-containing protein [Phaeodactylibacter sp.]|nr:DUF4397 domain-containing protein [Phaeodactylibacter sp.]
MKKLYLALLATLMSCAAYSQVARVQVIHNSPTPGTSSGPVVDIYVNGALLPALTAVPFRAATPFLDVPAGADIEVAVAVSPSNSVDDAIATFPLGQLADGEGYAVIANGIVGDADTPFGLEVYAGALESNPQPDRADFIAFHGSPGAPAVDISVRGGGTLIEGLAYGAFTEDYISVEPDAYFLDVRASGDPGIVATFQADLSGLPGLAGGVATVFASGILGGTPSFGLYAALTNGQVIEFLPFEVARLQVIHNAPAQPVDIYLNGELAGDDFEFRTATSFGDIPAGIPLNIGVAPGNSTSVEDTLANFRVVFENAKTYVAIANGIVGDPDTPFTLAVNDMGREAANDAGEVDLSVFHGSPDAPAVDVDIFTVGNVIDGLSFGQFTGDYLSVNPGLYYLQVRADGSPDVVATFEADLAGLAGGAATVFASGFLGADPGFGLFAALPSGVVVELPAVGSARLQVIHNAPSPTVDVYANGGLLIDDFEFRTATPFVDVPAGATVNIGVAPGNSTSVEDTLANFPVLFEAGETYVVVANGIVGDPDFPFTLAAYAPALEQGLGQDEVSVLVFHGSPGAPPVAVNDFAEDPLFDGLAYGEFIGYAQLAPENYFLEVRPSGSEDLVGTFNLNLTGAGGLSATLFASGIVGGEPNFGLFAALPNGDVIDLTPVALTQLIHNSPAAAAGVVDLWANNVVKVEEDLAFQTATGLVYYPTRIPITLGVAPADSDDPSDILFNLPDPVVFEDGKYHVIIANGIPGDADTPFELAINTEANVFAPNAQSIDVSLFHGSPNAPAVDIVARDVMLPLANDFAYGEFEQLVALPPGNYYAEVYPAGSESLVATFESPLPPSSAGLSLVGVVSGLLGQDPPLDLLFFSPTGQAIRATPVAQVQVIHNSPAPTVDVYANGNALLPDFEFRTATPFVDLPTRTAFDIAVAPGNSASVEDSLVSFKNVIFEDGRKYVVIATGVVGDLDTPFSLAVTDMAQTRAEGGQGVDLLLYHGAPDAPEVDVVAPGAGVLFDDVEYGEFQGYLNVPASAYVLNVTPGNDNSTVVRAYDADLSGLDGGAATVFASGFLGSEDEADAFGVWVALPNGETFPLTQIVSTREIADIIPSFLLAPNPVSSVAQVQYTLSEEADLTAAIQDAAGQVVRTEYLGRQPAGEHSRTFEAGALPPGLYTYSLITPAGVLAQRFVVAR